MPYSACQQHVVDPALPAGSMTFAAPTIYRTWWQMVEACSGVQSDLAAVSWYEVPNTTTIPLEGTSGVGGYWSDASDEIVLASAVVLDGGLVRHEMLHALLRVGTHPRSECRQKGGGTVDCDAVCIADAGPAPAPDPASTTITPDKLRISIVVAPAAPNAATNDGFFAVTVFATNATGGPVIVSLPDRSATYPGATFGYHLQAPTGGVGGNLIVLDRAVVDFASGETKRYVFDFRIQSPAWAGLVPGTYSVGGSFGQQWSYDTTLLAP